MTSSRDTIEPPNDAAAGAVPAVPKRERDPWFDNIKMALVTLVVIGHAWTLLPESTTTSWLYDFIYAWHIPAFVIITGYLSKSFAWTPDKMWSLVRTVAVPYVIFEALLAWFRLQFGGVELKDLFTDPHWPMWYLSALFFWRLMTPIFLRLKAKVAIAAGISLVAGLYAGDLFDMARIFGLLPFFVLGLKMHDGHWTLLRSPRTRRIGLTILIAILVLARFTDNWIETEWLYYRSRYDALDPDDLRAATIRLVLLFVGLLGAFSFFTLVPRTRSWFTALGSATLVVYLFHGFLVLGGRYFGYEEWAADQPLWLTMPVTTVLSIVVALVLAWRPIAHRLNYVVDPIGTATRWTKKGIDKIS